MKAMGLDVVGEDGRIKEEFRDVANELDLKFVEPGKIEDKIRETLKCRDEELESLAKEYQSLCHAMMSGVSFLSDKSDQTPKQLRVGINSAHVSDSAIVALLIKKGLISRKEFMQSLVEMMKCEVERYREQIAQEKGVPVENIILR